MKNKLYITKQTYQGSGTWKVYLKDSYNCQKFLLHKGKVPFIGKCWIIELKKWWKQWESFSKKEKKYLTSPWLEKSIIIKNKNDYIDGTNGWYLKNPKIEKDKQVKMEIKSCLKKIKKLILKL